MKELDRARKTEETYYSKVLVTIFPEQAESHKSKGLLLLLTEI